MFGISIESSHKRGMGHLFRAINFISYLEEKKEPYILMLNEDQIAESILFDKKIRYEIVPLFLDTDWESAMIQKYGITVWFNDRLNTKRSSAEHVKKNKIPLFTMDDMGEGAALSDGNFVGMIFEDIEKLPGKKIYAGEEYLILNPEISACRFARKDKPLKEQKILVTLGGSDTYGVTLLVLKLLKKANRSATLLLGPSAKGREEVLALLDERFTLIEQVPSLILEFQKYDLAITGGGVTPFEANASGLPCIIIANEEHEIQIGKHLEALGTSKFAGFYQKIEEKIFTEDLPLAQMSLCGLKMKAAGAENIYKILKRGF